MSSSVTPTQKVAELLDRHPQTYHVFLKYGCPDMREGFFSLMARIMSIRNAARIHRIPLDELLEDLEAAIVKEETTGKDSYQKSQS
ncbi:MAG: DUF1858 domain-containing protein [Balneolaceae bacterium]|nr:DUF1858 domain-containing protein [Balneolaceae bacterium]